MDFFFPQDDLERVGPAHTHIENLEVTPYPDGRRVRVNLHITPFLQRPHLEVTLVDGGGSEVATASIVEPMTWKLELTMHLRGRARGSVTVVARLFYPDGPQQPPISRTFEAIPQE